MILIKQLVLPRKYDANQKGACFLILVKSTFKSNAWGSLNHQVNGKLKHVAHVYIWRQNNRLPLLLRLNIHLPIYSSNKYLLLPCKVSWARVPLRELLKSGFISLLWHLSVNLQRLLTPSENGAVWWLNEVQGSCRLLLGTEESA